MKKLFAAAALILSSALVFAQESKPTVEVHGFIRNFYAFDTREMKALTEDFFSYVPLDNNYAVYDGEETDVNGYLNSRFAALTSRLWVEAKGYEVDGWKVGARIEGDFYNGLGDDKVTGTANFRLRQAFVSLSKNAWSFKAGQSWHPMAADMPDVFSLNTGAPFGPFSRTPLFQADYKLGGGLSLTAAAIWQMQYSSTGPDEKNPDGKKSASYIKWGNVPEFYLGLNYKADNLLLRAGLDVLSIKPRLRDDNGFVDDRITTMIPFFYAQYAKDLFSVKFKTVFAEAGDHLNLNGGYGVSGLMSDGRSWEYTPTRNSSSWLSLCYGKKVQWILFAGYVKNFGTKDALIEDGGKLVGFWFSGNSFDNFNSMYRLTPTVIYNLGKVAFGLEYELTSVQYGKKGSLINLDKGLYDQGLHWVTNHRLQGMIKYTF